MNLKIASALPMLCLLASSAQAQPGLAPPSQAPIQYQPAPAYLQQPAPSYTRTTSYGWQVFGADAASWLVLSLGAENSSNDGLTGLGVAGIFLGGPLVHLAQGNTSSAAYSLVARLGLPYAGAFLLSAGCEDSQDSLDCIGQLFLGAMLGYGTALGLDYFVLAKKTEDIAPSGWASLRPSLQISSSGTKAGLAFDF